MTSRAVISLCLLCASLGIAAPAPADPVRTTRGLDCRFFDSQAFNRADDHYTAAMARMCRLLSEYKTAIVANAMTRFHEDRDTRVADNTPVRRFRQLSTTNDTGNYLIAREIGLIEALTAVRTTD